MVVKATFSLQDQRGKSLVGKIKANLNHSAASQSVQEAPHILLFRASANRISCINFNPLTPTRDQNLEKLQFPTSPI